MKTLLVTALLQGSMMTWLWYQSCKAAKNGVHNSNVKLRALPSHNLSAKVRRLRR